MRWDVVHRTTYTYDRPVTDSYGLLHLSPPELAHQRVGSWAVRVEPAADDRAEEVDSFGNAQTYFQVTTPHTTLLVEATGSLEVLTPSYADEVLSRSWERLRPGASGAPEGAWRVVEHALPSPSVALASGPTAYAARSLLAGAPVGEAVSDLVHRIHADFDYDPSATTVTSTVQETFDQRAGVCQDFAHLTLACLRGHGLAARYVSGYLATEPPPGKARVVGADASHAWVEVWLGPDPAGGGPGTDAWLALDPTNDQWVSERYVTLARGRDYADVAPVKGVIFTEAERSTMDVSVDVAPVG